MIVGENIRKNYGETKILRSISISVERGKITALIGPSGSGKTTLLRVLSLLDPPTSGTVTINGTTYCFPLGEGEQIVPPWPRVTVVFQQLFLWPHLTLRRNITLPIRDPRKLERREHLDRLIDLLGMAEFIDRFPNEVSLGQRQRAALVRALVLEPEYLLLDEITSALDMEQTSAVLGHLQSLRNKGTGILISTHLMGFARRAADQVVFLEQGEVLEMGGPALLDSPKQERVRRFLAVMQSAM
jgi:ABC-type polar amino acid transport system ATPase subunit